MSLLTFRFRLFFKKFIFIFFLVAYSISGSSLFASNSNTDLAFAVVDTKSVKKKKKKKRKKKKAKKKVKKDKIKEVSQEKVSVDELSIESGAETEIALLTPVEPSKQF